MYANLLDYDLPAEDRDEFIQIAIKTHYFSFFKSFIKISVILLVLIAIFLLFGFGSFFVITALIGFTIIFYIIYRILFIWKNRVYLITNKRVICIYQENLLDRKVTEVSFSKILSTNYQIKGLAQHLFNFGSVELRIADSSQGIILKNIPDPYKIQEYVIDLKNKKTDKITKKTSKKRKNFLIR